MDTGGKGLYLGGLKEFEEYSLHYYGQEPPSTAELETLVAAENEGTLKAKEKEDKAFLQEDVTRVCLTNSTSPLAYHLLYQLATGRLLDSPTRLGLHLHYKDNQNIIQALIMELQDLASPQVAYIKATTSLDEALKDVDVFFILDWPLNARNVQICSSEHNQWADLMEEVGDCYRSYALVLKAWSSGSVKVCVTGCMANVGVAVMVATVPELKYSCIAAPSLLEMQAKTLLRQRLKIHHSKFSQTIIWGHTHLQSLVDHSFVRVKHFPRAAVVGPDPFDLPLTRCEFDKKWLVEEYQDQVLKRHRGSATAAGPAVAEAAALVQLARKWLLPEEWQEGEEVEEEEEEEEEERGQEEEEGTTTDVGTGKEEEEGSARSTDETDNPADTEPETSERREVKNNGSSYKEESGKEENSDGEKQGSMYETGTDREKSAGGESKSASTEGRTSSGEGRSQRSSEREATGGSGTSSAEGARGEGTPSDIKTATDGAATAGETSRTDEDMDESPLDEELQYGVWYSVGVVCDGTWYDIPAGLVVSLPCQCKEGVWSPVEALPIRKHIQVRSHISSWKLY